MTDGTGTARAGGDVADEEPDYRFTLANERTFLAWQRTALGLLAGAVAVIQFVPQFGIPGARHVVGLLLAALAIMTSGVGLVRWRQVDRAVRSGRPLPRHPTPAYLAIGFVLVAVIMVGLMVWRTATG